MPVNANSLQYKWDEKFDKLDTAFDSFREYFDKNRKCKCKDVDDCRHFDRAMKIFDEKLDELDDLNLKIFGKVYEEIIKPQLFPNDKGV
jgi:hypothetical protein